MDEKYEESVEISCERLIEAISKLMADKIGIKVKDPVLVFRKSGMIMNAADMDNIMLISRNALDERMQKTNGRIIQKMSNMAIDMM